jgi:hypothetical protein
MTHHQKKKRKNKMARLSVVEFAEILFTTSLQASDQPAPDQVWAAVRQSWIAAGADSTRFAARLAQEAGDHPEETARRMRWALKEAEDILQQPRMHLAG